MAEVNQVLTLPQIKKMKVAELRERLQKLDKPTTGLKPELVNRDETEEEEEYAAITEFKETETLKPKETSHQEDIVAAKEKESVAITTATAEQFDDRLAPVAEIKEPAEQKVSEVIQEKLEEKVNEVATSSEQLETEATSSEQLEKEATSSEQLEKEAKSSEQLEKEAKSSENLKTEATSSEKLKTEAKSSEKLETEATSSEKLETETVQQKQLVEQVPPVAESAEQKVSEVVQEKREKKAKEDVVTVPEQMETEAVQPEQRKEDVAPVEETVRQKHTEKETVSKEETKLPEQKETETVPQKPPKERKRRWGSTSISSSNVSTKTDDTVNTKITPNITKLNNSTNQTGIGQSNSEATVNRGTNGVIETKRTDEKRLQKSHSVSEDIGKTSAPEQLEGEEIKRRSSTPALKETKADEAIDTKKAPSPAHNAPTNIVFIRNLVRPFTLLQLKEILGKNGKINEEKFWIDKIKSKCYVAYETQEEAVNARESLHGLRWPEANPKTLVVDFATLDELEYHLNLEKGVVPQTNQQEPPKQEIKRQTEAPKPTSKDKYDIVIRRERHDEKERQAKDDKKEDHKREDVKVEKRPIREWDREKLLRKDNGERFSGESSSPIKRKRSVSHSPRRGEGDVRNRDKERGRGMKTLYLYRFSLILTFIDAKSDHRQREKAPETESPANLLDGLFKKTKATPCIYWLPLTEDQAKKRAEERIETERRRNEERVAREAERKKRIEEMNRSRRPSPPVRRL
ncbi:apoptotic chromatin condensation inducer in the nucleus-like isoform X2 [Leptotrombidium deliense]|uniref:Apoptotic chromatin condensation inducer in the nucleus-like isoform X2 n=1 Tax=Leptotrombidium deliense TaxID=299467 RepID=A0A443SDL0_9ACAR|nr:apoptotic chromatin condensation inducer in the nucleus-like isoform X2 [Leptotrombidium deliense]